MTTLTKVSIGIALIALIAFSLFLRTENDQLEQSKISMQADIELAPQSETELQSQTSPQATAELTPREAKIARAKNIYTSALDKKASAKQALDAIEQRVEELESKLNGLEAQGEDLIDHQDETQPLFQQLFADYQRAAQRLDDAEAIARDSLLQMQDLEREP